MNFYYYTSANRVVVTSFRQHRVVLPCTVAKEKCKQNEFAHFYFRPWKVCPLGKCSGWVVIAQRCSIWNGWNRSSNRTDLLHSVQVSHLQSNSFAHLSSGGDLDSKLAPGLLREPARSLWDVKDYPSVIASTTVCNTSKLGENLWQLIRNLFLWISSPAWDTFLFQPIYLL